MDRNARTALLPPCASAIALLGALGLMPGSASALAIAGPPPCADTSGLPPDPQRSQVTDAVTDNGDGTFTYEFRVCNLSTGEGADAIMDWELPFFGSIGAALDGSDSPADNEGGIHDIMLPSEWLVSIEQRGVPNPTTGWSGDVEWLDPADPFFDDRYTGTDLVLHFHTVQPSFGVAAPIFPGDELPGFGFTASFGPTGAPYQASWVDLPNETGDPAFPLAAGFPNSPSLQRSSVPEPGSLAALGAGLLALATTARRRRRRPHGDDDA